MALHSVADVFRSIKWVSGSLKCKIPISVSRVKKGGVCFDGAYATKSSVARGPLSSVTEAAGGL